MVALLAALTLLAPPAAAEPIRQVAIERLVLNGPTTPSASIGVLEAALGAPTKGWRAEFLATPGGFLTAPFPADWQGRAGWQSRPEDLRALIPVAQKAAEPLLNQRFLQRASERADYITLGIDVTTPKGLDGPHAEFVGVLSTRLKEFVHWTGKSYPLARQEDTLVAEADVRSHLFRSESGERVLLLGCHDLNMLSPRARANQSPRGERRQRSDALRAAALPFRPTMVLQHPHGTDTPNIWLVAWRATERMFPTLESWASAIGYFNYLGGEPRASLERVLALTRSDPESVRDVVMPARVR